MGKEISVWVVFGALFPPASTELGAVLAAVTTVLLPVLVVRGGSAERKQRKRREKGPRLLEGRRGQDEQTVFLLFDPLEQLVDQVDDVVPVHGGFERRKQLVRLGDLREHNLVGT